MLNREINKTTKRHTNAEGNNEGMAEKDADEFKTDSCCLFNNNVNDRACTDDRKNKRKKMFMKIIKDEMTTDVNGLHEKEEALQIDMKRD